MRFTFLLCLLTTTLVHAQQSTSAPEPSSSTAPADDAPTVVKLASQKVTIPAAQIPLTTLDGKDVRLGDHDAKVVVVSLWSTISPEHSVLKYLEGLHKSYRGSKDVVVLAINVDMPKNADDMAVIREIAKEMGVTYPMLIDKELKLLALSNERLRPEGMERNTFTLPPFLLFSRKFEKMEQPSRITAEKDEEIVKELRKEVERVRQRK
ncbi:TlpA disulfide reductase family protein [Hyalangium gracile]|uniref:TlpA disulfide reductase family protein n=1 Tax=Hyalangium gracile TaxID=394092 RepID=UPI001CCFA7CB|nr:TlpA disulfide reductase family protein [Hyalangium gracile]